ncbi:hypothetical protein DPMN_103517 [Dreissena polymorpha]|uniref:Uncharacterized protein n=1 Tax=Dreissena polymorpha TaxID=45954 RepID=A0A9D4HB71_DREPO|nr:hypothetical protein DPMN_103517 [Dreissena polymorpha]
MILVGECFTVDVNVTLSIYDGKVGLWLTGDVNVRMMRENGIWVVDMGGIIFLCTNGLSKWSRDFERISEKKYITGKKSFFLLVL